MLRLTIPLIGFILAGTPLSSEPGMESSTLALEILGAVGPGAECESGLLYEFEHGDLIDTVQVSVHREGGRSLYAYASRRGRVEGVLTENPKRLVELRMTDEDGALQDLDVPDADALWSLGDSLRLEFAARRAEGEGYGFLYGSRTESDVEIEVGAGRFVCTHHEYFFQLPEELGGEELTLLEVWESTMIHRIVPPQMSNSLSMYVTGSPVEPWHRAVQGGIVALRTQSRRFELIRPCEEDE
jgi:hypothetical protein